MPVSKKGFKNILHDSFFHRSKHETKLCDQKTRKKAMNLRLSSFGKYIKQVEEQKLNNKFKYNSNGSSK
jgi:hypothetical protein